MGDSATATQQRPVELILARGLIQHLTTPAMLVDIGSTVVYFNDPAADLLGVRYEETGPMSADERCQRFEPIDDEGRPIPRREFPIEIALNEERPAFRSFRIRTADGALRRISASAVPIASAGVVRGALAIFWPEDDAPPDRALPPGIGRRSRALLRG